ADGHLPRRLAYQTVPALHCPPGSLLEIAYARAGYAASLVAELTRGGAGEGSAAASGAPAYSAATRKRDADLERLATGCSPDPTVADVGGQRRVEHLDRLDPERCLTLEDPLACTELDRNDVDRQLVDYAGGECLPDGGGAARDVDAVLAQFHTPG